MFRLNLVALMDIFTILIFFLLLNTGESQKIENAKFIDLPDSASGIDPHNELLIFINDETIWLGEQEISKVADVMAAPDKIIEPLKAALLKYKSQIPELKEYEKRNGLPITIMGDKSVTFRLLKSVMETCQDSDFRDISLAVNQIIANPLEGSLKLNEAGR